MPPDGFCIKETDCWTVLLVRVESVFGLCLINNKSNKKSQIPHCKRSGQEQIEEKNK